MDKKYFVIVIAIIFVVAGIGAYAALKLNKDTNNKKTNNMKH